MPHTSEIEKALDDLIIDEAGMKFQALAVVLAKQKWPRLVACERKKGDASASRSSGFSPTLQSMARAGSFLPVFGLQMRYFGCK
jgi:hypothetical protein